MGIFNASLSSVKRASYSIVFFEHHFVDEKEYGMSAVSRKTNKISIPATLLRWAARKSTSAWAFIAF